METKTETKGATDMEIRVGNTDWCGDGNGNGNEDGALTMLSNKLGNLITTINLLMSNHILNKNRNRDGDEDGLPMSTSN